MCVPALVMSPRNRPLHAETPQLQVQRLSSKMFYMPLVVLVELINFHTVMSRGRWKLSEYEFRPGVRRNRVILNCNIPICCSALSELSLPLTSAFHLAHMLACTFVVATMHSCSFAHSVGTCCCKKECTRKRPPSGRFTPLFHHSSPLSVVFAVISAGARVVCDSISPPFAY